MFGVGRRTIFKHVVSTTLSVLTIVLYVFPTFFDIHVELRAEVFASILIVGFISGTIVSKFLMPSVR